MPSPSISDFDYAALLHKDGDSPSVDFVQGEVDGTKLTFSFQRPDETENISFTLEVFAFKKGTAAADFSVGTAVLSGKTKNDLTVNDGSETIDVNETIALLVNASSTAKGEVSLKIEVPAGCSLTIDDTANFDCKESAGASGTYIVTQKDASGIPAKAYPIKFTVMDGEKIVQVFTEYINVLHGMRTDTWGGLAKGAAKEIQITNSASTTFFVRGGTGTGWYTENGYESVTGDDANAGEFLRPFATIQKAVDTVLAMNDGTSAYTIYVDGTFTATSSDALADFDALSQPLTVKILGLSESSKAVLDGNGTARGIVVGSGSGSSARKNVNLTLENLTVQNAAGNGITLYCQSANAHTIKNCEIKNSNGGHGIYQYYGSLDLQGCTISGNKTTGDGGGVCSENGSLTMESGTITDNIANQGGGGGVCVSQYATFNMEGGTISGNKAKNGGGVYASYSAFTMKDGTIITDNTATGLGGGIFSEAYSLTMTGCTVSGNKAQTGAGIYREYYNGSDSMGLTMTNCTVSKNIATNKGGGVCAYTNNFTMEGCTIIGNEASNGGGVVFYSNMSSNSSSVMKDCTVSGNKANLGKGVYVEPYSNTPKLMLDRTTKFAEDDDIYLGNDGSRLSTVGVMSTLATAAPVATITPSAYTAGRQVLCAGTDVTIDEDVCKLFNVTPQKSETDESVTEWQIVPKPGDSTAGVLKAK